ncbi:allantoate amidohydrolase [Demequina sp. SYSU T00039]|uniref:Allantoate amidohydrolase n=1 Tax=Demequina lignilytica TaxID=3051663 RepID=A0AAW7MAC1_9MICO|nr:MULTISPECIES: allantoate amidohydrolase [unclassified Demequina]MDN4478788.1 allantoate amidohydrolase [Demequina sp. SYSU T00039-1]MDN4488886.1 allantoate amidohydrolase [Demequina sp. SYSU T00039]
MTPVEAPVAPATLDAVAALAELACIGRDDARGGWSRHLLDEADGEMRAWFARTAAALGLAVETDANANQWATWAPDGATGPAVGTGSHLDSVPGGGPLDGPLGVVSALAAVSRLMAEGHAPSRPVRIANFAEEEGARFGVPCLGSQLLAGDIDTHRVRALTDGSGASVAEVLASAGLDPEAIGRDDARLADLALYLELHVEQGRQLAPLGVPVGVATGILAHGRWRVTVTGRGDHAGATELGSRRDPMLVAAAVIRAARNRAAGANPATRARATVGKLQVVPGGSNAIASEVRLWLDARAEHDADVHDLVARILSDAEAVAREEGCEVAVAEESFSTRVEFDATLTDLVDSALGGVPRIPTGAGHDAGILAAHLPTAMMFVRNPDGVSHSPLECASDADIRAGVDALADALRALT